MSSTIHKIFYQMIFTNSLLLIEKKLNILIYLSALVGVAINLFSRSEDQRIDDIRRTILPCGEQG